MSERLCVVMPVYNEQEAIGPVLEKWAKDLDALGIDYVIRPYNDGSKDNSLSVMKSAAAHLPHVDVRDKKNGGHGNTILTGYREAAADGFDWVFQIDSDDEMGPEKFGELWSRRNDYDFLIGIRDGRVQQLPRKVISFISRLCVRIFYGKSVWDVNTPYRLMRVSAFKDFYQVIPLTTFAPNVILSGLAARQHLRCFDIRVPQHDRTTGEVSIKKWKLLKAAVRSFWQTIIFSLSSCSGNDGAWVGCCCAFVLWVVSVCAANAISYPWMDEIGTADTAVNCVNHGGWFSYVWPYSYNPLYLFVERFWIRIWGASHVSVCALSSFFCFLSCCAMCIVASSRKLIKGGPSFALLPFLLYGGWSMSWIVVNGRIDMLALLLSILLMNEIEKNGCCAWRVVLLSFFMMMSAIFTFPIIAAFGVCVMIRKGRPLFLDYAKKGCCVCVGIGIAYIVICLYYYMHHQLFRFVHSYFSYNATLSGARESIVGSVMAAYKVDYCALLLSAVGIIVSLVNKKMRFWSVLIVVIPALMVVSGRYLFYYSWMFYCPAVFVLSCAVRPSWARKALIVVICCYVAVVVCRVKANKGNYDIVDSVNAFIEANAKLFSEGLDVIDAENIVDDRNQLQPIAFYWSIVDKRCKVWLRTSLMPRSTPGPREKFEKVVERLVPKDKESALAIFDSVESVPPKMPSTARGLMVSREKSLRLKLVMELEKSRYLVRQVVADGEFSIDEWSKQD